MTPLQESFDDLETFLARYDPISLLSQLTLTFMFTPENEFQSESSDVFEWQRYIELLAGIALGRPLPSRPTDPIDGPVLTQLHTLIEKYFNEVSKQLAFEAHPNSENPDKDFLLIEAKIESLYVRGDAYPHQFFTFAQGLYGSHDQWFTAKYGFTIEEAIRLAKAIGTEYSERVNRSGENARAAARRRAEELIAEGEFPEDQRRDLEKGIFCALHFGQADSLLAFSADELAQCSGGSPETCKRFLGRMSQPFGYRNPAFPNTFIEAAKAPWDYNTLSERPLVSHDGKYWLFVPPLLVSSVFNTFFFDLMGDDEYRPIFEKARGAYVERKTAEFVCRVFPEMTFLNPTFPNGEELADAIVLHDHKVLIFQCKSKALTRLARIGGNFDALRKDVQNAIADAFQQCVRARKHLKEHKPATFRVGGCQCSLDADQVNEIYLICVTAMPLQTLAARLANTNSTLGLFPDNEYPWSLSLGDLDVVTQVLRTPARFLHYAQRRRQVEATPFRLNADEMDYLGFYLLNGMRLEAEEFKGMDAVGLSGFSDDLDRWVYETFELDRPVDPPQIVMTDAFSNFLRDIESSSDEYRTDCAIALLDLSTAGRNKFIEMVTQTKEQSKHDGCLHSFSLVLAGGKRGLSFVSLDSKEKAGQLFMQSSGFAMAKKYDAKCDEWVGFGWDISSAKSVDVSFFISQPWTYDAEIEKVLKSVLRPGRRIELGDSDPPNHAR